MNQAKTDKIGYDSDLNLFNQIYLRIEVKNN